MGALELLLHVPLNPGGGQRRLNPKISAGRWEVPRGGSASSLPLPHRKFWAGLGTWHGVDRAAPTRLTW